MIPTKSIVLPKASSYPNNPAEIITESSIVIIGANGTGKTRLGSWLDINSKYTSRVHRISAQKSLNLLTSFSTSSIEQAEAKLIYGYPDKTRANKQSHRWQNNPNTLLLNDFEFLMTYLFSEHYEQSTKYLEDAQGTNERVEPPKTKLDTVKHIWDSILPRRKLKISANKIETQIVGNNSSVDAPLEMYNASEMSDGERVILYLIGQALSAPKDGMIIIDEPELHVHKSIQSILWNKIEAQRPDCFFVYLTHDLDFAASRVGAAKICLTDYTKKDGTDSWDWFLVPPNDGIPEEIYLKILGSRKPILFVEGNKSSYDRLIYENLYPCFTVIPCDGCGQVMNFTKAFSNMQSLHRIKCYGIIDRDKRTDEQVEYIRGLGIFVLDVSEIENLFLTRQVLEALAIDSRIDEFNSLFDKVKDIVFDMVKSGNEKEKLISAITAARIEASFKRFDAKAVGIEALKSSVNDLLSSSITVEAFYQESENLVDDIINNKKYDELIKIYNNKGILAQVVPLLDKLYKNFPKYIKKLITSNDGQKFVVAMKKYIPTIPTV